MSSYSAHQSPGLQQAAQVHDPLRTPSSQQHPPPPAAPSLASHQQSGYSQGQQASAGQYAKYGAQQQGHGGDSNTIYSPPQASNPNMGLAGQMGGLTVSGDGSAQPRTNKKKQRHAYHDFGQPSASSQPQTSVMQGYGSTQGPFLNAGQMQQHGPSNPKMGQGPAQPMAHMSTADRLRSGEEMVATQGRVDPEQIPSIPRSRDAAAQYYLTQVYPTMERHLPPPATVPFVAHDQGNASPKFARLTLNKIPSTSESLATTALPLGMILQPLAPLQDGEQAVPVLDFGDAGPPRCRRCRTYINPFMTFRSGGNKLVCNMCNFPNDVVPEYFAPTDPSGVRVDRLQRPELMLGTCEFLVPREYWAKEPVGLRWLFVIDVSQVSVEQKFLQSVCEGIRHALYGNESEQQNGDQSGADFQAGRLPTGSKVGIVTFDKEVHFYNLSVRLDQAQMMIMTDLEEPFVPLSEGLFVDPHESKSVISSLLDQLSMLFSVAKSPEPALLPALNASLAALAHTGGKIVCTLCTLPTWGPGRLIVRDDGKGRDTDAEKKLLTTEHPGFKKTASSMVSAGVGADFFLAANGGHYMDIATIGHISALTGGEVFFYPNYYAPRDHLKLAKEIKHTVTRETGYQALMKVRCSNGLQVSSYHGNFLQHTFGADIEIGTIDADKAMGIIFSYDGKLDTKLDAHFQAALLYTSASGQRRVRCINIVAGVMEGAMESMRTVDQDAVVSIIAKEASSKVADKTLKDIRAGITEKTIDVLAGYRKNFSGSHPPGQLVLPENLKEFSMYMLGLIKSRAFKGGISPPVLSSTRVTNASQLEMNLQIAVFTLPAFSAPLESQKQHSTSTRALLRYIVFLKPIASLHLRRHSLCYLPLFVPRFPVSKKVVLTWSIVARSSSSGCMLKSLLTSLKICLVMEKPRLRN
jgi:protein transport protein SEC24